MDVVQCAVRVQSLGLMVGIKGRESLYALVLRCFAGTKSKTEQAS